MEKYKYPDLNEAREAQIEACFEDAWNVNPTGIKDNCFLDFKKQEINRNIPAEILRDRYIAYVNFCLPHQNEKFTKSQFIIKNISDYCYYRMYEQEFKNAMKSNSKRDKYLYGI